MGGFPKGIGYARVVVVDEASMVDSRVILAGAIPAAVLALAADVGLGAVEKRLGRI